MEIGNGRGGVQRRVCFLWRPMVIGSRDLVVRGVQSCVFVAPPWRLRVNDGCPKNRVYLWRPVVIGIRNGSCPKKKSVFCGAPVVIGSVEEEGMSKVCS